MRSLRIISNTDHWLQDAWKIVSGDLREIRRDCLKEAIREEGFEGIYNSPLVFAEYMDQMLYLLTDNKQYCIQCSDTPTQHDIEEILSHSLNFTELGLIDCISQKCKNIVYYKDAVYNDLILDRALILSGSFNPLHIGHLKMMEEAGDYLDKKLCNFYAEVYEISILNADKGLVADEVLLNQRICQFTERDIPVMITGVPFFYAKAEYFSKQFIYSSYFILGFDTVVRILDTKYYKNMEDMMEKLRYIASRGNKALVAGRLHNDSYQTLRDLSIYEELQEMFIELPGFRFDISSTMVRSGEKEPFSP